MHARVGEESDPDRMFSGMKGTNRKRSGNNLALRFRLTAPLLVVIVESSAESHASLSSEEPLRLDYSEINTAFATMVAICHGEFGGRIVSVFAECHFDRYRQASNSGQHSIDPIERLNGEIKRRTDVIGVSPMTKPSSVSSTLISPGTAGFPGDQRRQLHHALGLIVRR